MIPQFSPSPVGNSAQSAATVVQDLLEAGADPLVRDLFGLTPLHRACIAGNTEVIRVLLEKDPRGEEGRKMQLAVTDNHGGLNVARPLGAGMTLCLSV